MVIWLVWTHPIALLINSVAVIKRENALNESPTFHIVLCDFGSFSLAPNSTRPTYHIISSSPLHYTVSVYNVHTPVTAVTQHLNWSWCFIYKIQHIIPREWRQSRVTYTRLLPTNQSARNDWLVTVSFGNAVQWIQTWILFQQNCQCALVIFLIYLFLQCIYLHWVRGRTDWVVRSFWRSSAVQTVPDIPVCPVWTQPLGQLQLLS